MTGCARCGRDEPELTLTDDGPCCLACLRPGEPAPAALRPVDGGRG